MNGRLEKEQKLSCQTEKVLESLPDYVWEWYNHMEASDKSSSTRSDFVYKIKKYMSSINSTTENIDIKDLTYKSVVKYMSSIKTKENNNGEIISTSGSYQRTVWSALNSFFSFLKKRNYIDNNPMEDIDVSKKKDDVRIKRNKKYMQLEDFKKILDATNNQKNIKTRYRDKAILLILMCTGIRRRALSQINIQDINFEKNILTVIDKENAERDCALTKETIDAIKEWMIIRKEVNTDALFLSNRGKRISEDDIYNVVKKYSLEGLGYTITPHKIRAGFCTILYNNTKDIRYVQEIVGHSNIQTTQRYTMAVQDDGARVKEIFNNIEA